MDKNNCSKKSGENCESTKVCHGSPTGFGNCGNECAKCTKYSGYPHLAKKRVFATSNSLLISDLFAIKSDMGFYETLIMELKKLDIAYDSAFLSFLSIELSKVSHGGWTVADWFNWFGEVHAYEN